MWIIQKSMQKKLFGRRQSKKKERNARRRKMRMNVGKNGHKFCAGNVF